MPRKFTLRPLAFALIFFGGFASTITAAPGDLDTTFASTGFAREAGSIGTYDIAFASALQADGKIVSVGWHANDNLLSCGMTRHNSDGSIDTSFDGDGRAVVQVVQDFRCEDVAVQADGKLIVVGWINIGSNYNFAVFRFNPDGSQDNSFDGDGRRISSFINADFASAVAIQPDGKIVVCGNMGDNFLVVRYNSNGSFDTSFDGDGWVTTDFFGFADHAHAVAIQSDGKIIAAGTGTSGGHYDFAIARYNADGSLDTSFDGDGKVLTSIQSLDDSALTVVIQPDGKILVGGDSWGSESDFGIARYNQDGSLDTSFDVDGRLAIPFGNSFGELALQADGKIIAAGGNGSFMLSRLNPDGSYDTSFDGDGNIVLSIPGIENGNAVSIQPDGKIVAAGSSSLGTTQPYEDFAVVRLNSNATFDTSFSEDGVVSTNIHSWRVSANAVAIQPDGKIIAVGMTHTGTDFDRNFLVHRYNPDGTLDTSFDGDGRAVTGFGTTYDEAFDVALQTDGKIVVAGVGSSIFAIARYSSNGTLDTSFDGDGRRTESVSLNPSRSAIAVQPDGKILLAGSQFFLGYRSVIYRYNPDGTRDNSFDSDGQVNMDLGGDDGISDIKVQPDGKIVVVGKAQTSTYDFMVARYNSDGSLDTSFDLDGIALIDFVGGYDYANEMVLQPDGKIVVVGASSSDNNVESSNYDSALARLNADGSLDTSFDGDGKARVPVSIYSDVVNGVVLQPDGKILTAGTVARALYNDIGSEDFVLVRYNSSGSLDNSYGINGKAITGLFNNDMANDIALDSSGRAVVAGETGGLFTVARFLGGAAPTIVMSPFDFDGDGKSDISIFRPSNGQWWYQRSLDTQVLAFQFGNSTDRLAPADYTGDGKTDIAIWRSLTGEWFVLRSDDYSYYSVPFGTDGDVPTPADFDADGKADLTVFRASSGTWYINRSSGGTDILAFGQAGDLPTVEDFDGDGKSDLAIFRPSSGQWWLNRSTAGVIAATFGTGTDKPVVGDYTGDGKADISFWRPSTGGWFILRSDDFSYYSVPFGATGDTPTPGDYDGDGRFDTAVFRPSTQNWFINRTTSGLLIQQFGVSGDTPVPSAFVP